MNQSIATLTATLQKALDSNYDVIDMATVLFVISQLENATITKEQLETTRLAKYINQLRRRTCSESLARRAKNLIKKWREIFIPQQQQQSNSSAPAASTSGTGYAQQQSQQQLRSTQLQDAHNSFCVKGSNLPNFPETPSSNLLLGTGIGCEDLESSNTSYSQHCQQQQQYSGYGFHYNSRQLPKQNDLSLPDYPNSNYNRKLNTGSANKRNQIVNDSGGDGGGGGGSSGTLPQQMLHRSHTTHVQNYDPHERPSKYIKETSLPEHPRNNYNRKSNNTRSANQMEQKYQQQQQQQQRVMSNGGGSNLSIDDRLMTGNNRTRMKSSKFEKTENMIKDSNSNKSKRNSNKSQPTSFANLLPTSTDNNNLQSSAATHPSFIIDDRSHSPLVSLSSSCKLKLSHAVERRSPVLIEHSVSPLDFEHNSNQSRDNSIIVSMKNESDSAAMYCSNKLPMMNGESRLGSMVELNDYNSNSNLMMNTLDSSMQPSSPLINLYNNSTNCNPDDNETSTEHRKNKKHKKDKKKHKQQQQQNQKISKSSTDYSALTTGNNRITSDHNNMEENYQLSKHSHHQENVFPPHDSLSNSSLSIFPSTNMNTITSSNINQDNIDGVGDGEFHTHVNSKKSDLTFAGKFKNSNSYSVTEDISQSHNFSVMNSSIPNAQNNTSSIQLKKIQRKENDSVVVIESRSCSPFTSIATGTVAANSFDSSTSSSHHDMVDVMVANKETHGGSVDNSSRQAVTMPTIASTRERRGRQGKASKQEVPSVTATQFKSSLVGSGNNNSAPIAGDGGSEHNQQLPTVNAAPVAKIPKKRGRKRRLKTAELPPSNPGNFLNTQLFENSRLLPISTLTTNKKVKTTKELLADIQSRKLESAASSPILIHSQSSRVPSPCSEVSLHSPSTSDACSTNATMSTIARSTPDLQSNLVAARSEDVIDDSASNSNTVPGINTVNSQKSVQNFSSHIKKNSSTKTDNEFSATMATEIVEKHQQQGSSSKQQRTVDDEIEDLMKLLPPIDRAKIKLNDDDEVVCSCYVRTALDNQDDERIKVDFTKDEEHLSVLTATSPMVVISPGNATLAPIISASPAVKSLKSLFDDNSISILLSSSKQSKTPLTSPCSKSHSSPSEKMISSRKPPIKSIFDLDYDEDDDPLNSIVETTNNSCGDILCTKAKSKNYDDDIVKKSNECNEYTNEYNNEANDDDIYNMIKIKKKVKKISKQHSSISDVMDNSSTSESSQQSITAAMLQSLEQQQQQLTIPGNLKSSVPPQTSQFPQYEVIEDSNCPAKNLYVTQRNKITMYHINALHNRFIPNINGNWDHSGVVTTKTTTTTTTDFIIVTDETGGSKLVKISCDDDEMTPDGLYKRVVPQYNHIIMDRIPKDLSHIEFTKNYKAKKFTKRNINNNKTKNHKFELNIDSNNCRHFKSLSSESTLFNGVDKNNHSEDDDYSDEENDMTLHKHVKRKRLNDNDKNDDKYCENKDKFIRNNIDKNDKISLLTINLDDDDEDDVIVTTTFNGKNEISNSNNTKNNSHESFEKNDVIMLAEDDNNRDNNDHIMKEIRNESAIKLDTDDDNDDDDDGEELVINKRTINNEFSINNNDDNDDNSLKNVTITNIDTTSITVTMIQDQKEEEQQQKQQSQDSSKEEQIKGQKIIDNKDFLNDKNVSRRRRSSSCSSSSSNHNNNNNNFNNHNINLNNNDNDDNISNNNRNFINNKNENDNLIDNINNVPSSVIVGNNNNNNINDNGSNNRLDENSYDNNNSMENDNQQLSSRNSIHSNYLEEHYHDNDDDEDIEEDDDDEDYNDEGDGDNCVGGGDGSNSSDFHHQMVTHDMTSSTSTTSQKHIVLTIKKTPVDNNSRHQQQQQQKSQQEQNKDDDFIMVSSSPANKLSSSSTTITYNNTADNSISNITTIIDADNDLGNINDKHKNNDDFDVISENMIPDNNSIEKELLCDNDNGIEKLRTTTTSSEKSTTATLLTNNVCSRIITNENHLISNKSSDMAVSSVNVVSCNDDDDNKMDKKNIINNYKDNKSSIIKNLKEINPLKRKYNKNNDYDQEDINDDKMIVDSIDYDDNDDDDDDKNNNSEYNSINNYYHHDHNNDGNDSSDNDSNTSDKYDIDSLPIENNEFLESFNNLTEENRTGIRKIKKQLSTNTDTVNNLINTEKTKTSLTVNDDGNNNINSSNINCNSNNNINNTNKINNTENNQDKNEQEEQQSQQFKEWYEVHQVHSYNDELLTILPYVVID